MRYNPRKKALITYVGNEALKKYCSIQCILMQKESDAYAKNINDQCYVVIYFIGYLLNEFNMRVFLEPW